MKDTEFIRLVSSSGISAEHSGNIIAWFLEYNKKIAERLEKDRSRKRKLHGKSAEIPDAKKQIDPSLSYSSLEPLKDSSQVVVTREPEVFPTKSDIAEAAEDWNTIAEVKDLARVRLPLTSNRLRQLKARLREFGSIDAFDDYLVKVRDSPFLCGENDRSWRISFDDALKPRFVTKVLEGAYDQKKQAHGGNGHSHDWR